MPSCLHAEGQAHPCARTLTGDRAVRETRAAASFHPVRRIALICLAPLLVMAGLSMACNAEQFAYGEHARATDAFVRTQSTAYAETVRATSTAEAPAAGATATAIAQQALDGAPEAVRSLHERFGLTLVRVPAGDFILGEDLPDLGISAETRSLEEFWIGLTEVTNAEFARFVDAGGYDDEALWTGDGWQWRGEQAFGGPVCAGDEAFGAPHQPVTCVSLYEAQAFAAWLSRESELSLRLPTAEEWEKGARGPDGRRYPWGDEPPDASLAVYAAALGQTADVGSRPAGVSPYGLLDMAGNAAEWTGSPSTFSDDYIVRGGSWFDYAGDLVPRINRYYDPGSQLNLNGFRLVANLE